MLLLRLCCAKRAIDQRGKYVHIDYDTSIIIYMHKLTKKNVIPHSLVKKTIFSTGQTVLIGSMIKNMHSESN